MTAKPASPVPEPPRHLRPATRLWWASVVADYTLEGHHVRLLTLASEAWDRAELARETLAKKGLTFIDKHKQPRARPEVSIANAAAITFARLLRELALDVAPPDSRPPGVRWQGAM